MRALVALWTISILYAFYLSTSPRTVVVHAGHSKLRKLTKIKPVPTAPPKPLRVHTWYQVSSQYNDNRWKKANCALCRYAANEKEADFVFAHPHKTKVRKHAPNQLWVAQFWESEGNYPSINPPNSFDASISYRKDADFPNYAMMKNTFVPNGWTDLVPFKEKKKREMMSVWISNCGFAHRMRLLKELKLSYASYGNCLHDHSTTEAILSMTPQVKAWEKDTNTKSGAQKMAHASQYLFMFSPENNVSPYYHTEKVFHALMAGTVPIYHGADTIYEYVPEHSIIDARKWGNRLAEHLKDLAGNETKYNEYLEWRKKPLPKAMVEKLEHKAKGPCDICLELIHKKP